MPHEQALSKINLSSQFLKAIVNKTGRKLLKLIKTLRNSN